MRKEKTKAGRRQHKKKEERRKKEILKRNKLFNNKKERKTHFTKTHSYTPTKKEYNTSTNTHTVTLLKDFLFPIKRKNYYAKHNERRGRWMGGSGKKVKKWIKWKTKGKRKLLL